MNYDEQEQLKFYSGLAIALIAGLGFLMWKGAGATGLDIASFTKSCLGIIGVGVALYFAIKLSLPKAFVFPAIAILLVVCLFPALNFYALEASEKSFNQRTNFLGQPVQEFSAIKITVLWGMWYMKALYLAIAGLIAFVVAKALYPEESYF